MAKQISVTDISVVKERLTTLRRDGIENLDSFLKEFQDFVFSDEYVRIPETLKREIASIAQRREMPVPEVAGHIMTLGVKYNKLLNEKKDSKGDKKQGEEDYDDLGL